MKRITKIVTTGVKKTAEASLRRDANTMTYSIMSKKLLSIVLIISLIYGISGCTAVIDYKKDTRTDSDYNRDLSETENLESDDYAVEKTCKQGFDIWDKVGDNYYGSYYTQSSNGLEERCVIIYPDGKELSVKNAQKLPDWTVASGTYVVMQNKYLYEWKCYTSEFSDGIEFDVKLLRLNCENGIIDVIDENKSNSPFVYLSKLDDTRFISYTVSKVESSTTEYATQTSVSIYDIVNNISKPIITERFENDISWENSSGRLLERVTTNNGYIYGIGRTKVDGVYKFFLYKYDDNGEFLNETELVGVSDIIGDEQFHEIKIIGNYLVFRSYETLSTFICKIQDGTVYLLASGESGHMQYALTNDKIYYIESNVDEESAEVIGSANPIYEINCNDNSVRLINYKIDINEPYFIGIKSTDNDDIILQYSPDGEYNPVKLVNYLVCI